MTSQTVAAAGGGGLAPRAARAAVPGLATPFPLREQVPSMLMDDEFASRFLDGLDSVIAPVISVLDCFDSYLDPHTAPEDFVAYLGSWLLATLDDPWDEPTLRRDVADAYARARSAGTTAGLYQRLVPHVLRSATIRDTGSTTASSEPSNPADWPDAPPPIVRIIAIPRSGTQVDLAYIERIIRDVLPAHIGLELTSA